MNDGLDSRARHRRSPATILKAMNRPANFRAVAMALTHVQQPVDFIRRYLTRTSDYPTVITVRTPEGPVPIAVFSHDDVATINEIFFRGDYDLGQQHEIVVDFGSNIGISALFMLTRNPNAFVYCYEPVEQNADRLDQNLAAFAGRYELHRVAVGESDGTVRFGWEPTGKYGGVNRDTGRWIDVPCRDSNAVLAEVIAKHGRIDLLKIDVETLEKVLTERIPGDLLRNIGCLCVEFPFADNPLAATHGMKRRNAVRVFTCRS